MLTVGIITTLTNRDIPTSAPSGSMS